MLRGVDDMSTQDIFKYFHKYPPRNLEWIDDTSCKYPTWSMYCYWMRDELSNVLMAWYISSMQP